MPFRSARRLALLSLAAAALAVPAGAAWAETYPARPLKIVVPFGAGGVADLTARTVAQPLATALGQPVIIENKPGAGGVVAAETVARAAPDGHTLLLMSNGNAVSAGLFPSLPYDTLRDFTPVSTLGFFDIAIVTTADARFHRLADLLAYARANPGRLNIGSINIGSTQHLTAELFKTHAGVDLQIIPFNGTPAVVQALRSGQIDAAVEILAPLMGQIQGGVLRALAVTGERRSPVLPDVPTAQESGVAGLVASSWNALAVPAGTPAAVVARLNREITAALRRPEVQQRLRALNVEARPSSPGQAQQLLASEIQRWGDVITRAGIPRQ